MATGFLLPSLYVVVVVVVAVDMARHNIVAVTDALLVAKVVGDLAGIKKDDDIIFSFSAQQIIIVSFSFCATRYIDAWVSMVS